MHINVHDFLVESVGYSRVFNISGERPDLTAVRLTKAIEGEVTISRLDTGLLVRGRVETEVTLECHRCLRTFDRPSNVRFSQLFSETPGDDELPIDDEAIDLAPLIEQELVLDVPIKVLCTPDCRGIEGAERYTKEDTPQSLQSRARITKGSKRGRT